MSTISPSSPLGSVSEYSGANLRRGPDPVLRFCLTQVEAQYLIHVSKLPNQRI